MWACQGTKTVSESGPAALATDKVGSFEASGLIFKDSVEVIAQEDPAVKGVTIYISELTWLIISAARQPAASLAACQEQGSLCSLYCRSLTDKLNSNFFDEPSQA
eukprot:jgi/Astpho2/566/Aster-x0024